MTHTISGREIDFERIWPAYLARVIESKPFPAEVRRDVLHLREHKAEALPVLRGYRALDESLAVLPAEAEGHRSQLCRAAVRDALADVFCGSERFADQTAIVVSIEEPYEFTRIGGDRQRAAASA